MRLRHSSRLYLLCPERLGHLARACRPLLPRGDQKAPRGRESRMMRRALAYLPGWRSLARTTPSEIPRIAT